MTFEQIRERAMALNEEDRLRLAMELLETVPDDSGFDDSSEDFLAEIQRRGSDGTATVSWETGREQGRARRMA